MQRIYTYYIRYKNLSLKFKALKPYLPYIKIHVDRTFVKLLKINLRFYLESGVDFKLLKIILYKAIKN